MEKLKLFENPLDIIVGVDEHGEVSICNEPSTGQKHVIVSLLRANSAVAPMRSPDSSVAA